jgi:Plant transposon protein
LLALFDFASEDRPYRESSDEMECKGRVCQKDIEGVFGILKQHFKFLKNFNNLHEQSDVDNAFVTCCMLHNMLLEHDGWLDKELAPYPGGVKGRLFKKFGNIYANAWNNMSELWYRGDDDTVDETLEQENRQPMNVAIKASWASRWAKVTAALVDHHEFGGAI